MRSNDEGDHHRTNHALRSGTIPGVPRVRERLLEKNSPLTRAVDLAIRYVGGVETQCLHLASQLSKRRIGLVWQRTDSRRATYRSASLLRTSPDRRPNTADPARMPRASGAIVHVSSVLAWTPASTECAPARMASRTE